VSFDELEQLLAMALANPQFRAPKHIPVLRKNGTGHVEASRLGNRQEQDRALEACWLKSSGNQDICIDNQTEWKHYRFGFRDRAVLMIWSI
jgi:hypothetical protein